MKIRLPADLKDQIEVASKQSGRSMNAEIVDRLEASFDPQNDPIALRQKMLEMEGDAALETLNSSKTKSELLMAQLLVIQMAKMCPPELISKDPSITKLVHEITDRQSEIMEEVLVNTIAGLSNFQDAINKRVESGQLKVVPESESPKNFSKAIDHLSNVQDSVRELDELLKKSAKRKPRASDH